MANTSVATRPSRSRSAGTRTRNVQAKATAPTRTRNQSAPAVKAISKPAAAQNGNGSTSSSGSVYVLVETNDGAQRILGIHASLGGARKAGKQAAGAYNPAVHKGTPLDGQSWQKIGGDIPTWALAFTSGASIVVTKHRVAE